MLNAIFFDKEWLGYAAAVCGFFLGGLSLLLPGRSLTRVAFAVGMGLLALEVLFATLGSASVSLVQAASWQGLRMTVLSFVPVSWLFFSLVFARGNRLEFLSRWWPVLVAALLLPLVTLLVLPGQMIAAVAVSSEGLQFALGSRGMWLHAELLLTYVLVLVNLERTFRAAVGVMRWRIKFIVVGLGLLFLVRIYTSSQKLLYHGWSDSMDTLQGLALIAASFLVLWSVLRCGLGEADVYPSRTVILGSVTFTLTGTYLLLVGLLAKVVGVFGGTQALPLQALLILGGLGLLGLVFVSDHARQRLELVLSRHFRRPSFDYRQIWQKFTARSASEIDETSFCAIATSFVSEIFHALSVTIWLFEQKREALRFGGSTILREDQAVELAASTEFSAAAWQTVKKHDELIDLERVKEADLQEWRRLCPAQFRQKGGAPWILPLRVRETFVGLLVLADRVAGRAYSVEEQELLRTLGLEIAATLLNMQLLQQRFNARETDALRTMSAFFAHDLKNTGSTLTLTLQNLRKHFGNPEFREDALHAISKSVDHVNRIVDGLSSLQRELKLDVHKEELNSLVRQVLAEMDAALTMEVTLNLEPVPDLVLDAQQFKKVLVNLLLNARDAVSNAGRVLVQTGTRGKWVWLSVKDNGCGMHTDFIRKSLFRPFQTTKNKGLGIGMFQSKMIIEAHGGRIEVESQVGVGTTFQVLLPQLEETI